MIENAIANFRFVLQSCSCHFPFARTSNGSRDFANGRRLKGPVLVNAKDFTKAVNDNGIGITTNDFKTMRISRIIVKNFRNFKSLESRQLARARGQILNFQDEDTRQEARYVSQLFKSGDYTQNHDHRSMIPAQSRRASWRLFANTPLTSE
jgi:hypothetical protein